ncbi:MAG: auracyanin [Oscillochloris sp.]|nr:auracyanin [Oscillochloris sp.]
MWAYVKRLSAALCLCGIIGILAACGTTEPATPANGGDTDLETAPPLATVPIEATTLATDATSEADEPMTETTEEPMAGTEGDGGATELATAAEGAQLAYTDTEMSAPANTELTATFNNESDSLQHNWVLVNGGLDVAEEVNNAALQSPPDFIPDTSDQILAATELLDPNSSDSVTFTTPDPGEYIYLCTFPGHFQGGMYGTLTVE